MSLRTFGTARPAFSPASRAWLRPVSRCAAHVGQRGSTLGLNCLLRMYSIASNASHRSQRRRLGVKPLVIDSCVTCAMATNCVTCRQAWRDEGIGQRHRADQDQHDQSHALLAIVRAVCKRHARAGQHENAANPPRRRMVALRGLEQLAILDDQAHRQEYQRAAKNPTSGESSSE